MTPLPPVVAPVTVAEVRRLSPTFLRIAFAGEDLADVGVDGPWFDQRIKIIFPPASGELPDLRSAGPDWYAAWQSLAEHERGAMRTYSVVDVYGTGADRRLVVDFVLHLEPGATGPASSWANTATPGDGVLIVAPRRGQAFGGIEFAPGDAARLLLAADETAVPALSRILADLPTDATGTAFCEVPHLDDVRDLDAPPGIDVRWMPRAGTEVGTQLVPGVLAHLADRHTPDADPLADDADADEADVGTVWETSTFSSSGDDLTAAGDGVPGLYAWIAGESRVVTTLRRHLVRDVGIDRRQVAFMGYWRKGVAMRG